MSNEPTVSPFLTLAEVAVYLRVNRETIYRLIRSKQMPAQKIGGQWRIRKTFIERMEK